MPKVSSSHIVNRFLEQRLRVVAPGEALPSVRSVMDACRVGPQTVTQAVRAFENRNLIDVLPKQGLFRAAAAHQVPGIDRVDVLYLSAGPQLRAMVQRKSATDGSFHGELIDKITQVAGENRQSLRMHLPAENENDADLIDQVAAEVDVRACITVGLTENTLLRSLTDAQIAVVNLFPASFQLPFNAITTDADEVVGAQFATLFDHGHRRIGYLNNVEVHHPHREILLRREAFYRVAVERGICLSPGHVATAGFAADQQKRVITAMLSMKDRPTGIICADQHLPVLYEVAATMGLQIGRDLSVVGTDDKPVARQVDPPASSLQVPREAAVKKAFQLLHEVSHGRRLSASDCVRAKVKMIHRRSIGPAPKA